jgi:hypothetical protein
MKVLSFREYKMLEDFLNFFENQTINESEDTKDSMISTILKGLSKDLKFNYALVFTFGAGIKAMLPIVQNLIENENIKVELTTENLVLITLASLAITYLEESGNKSGDGQVPCDCVKKLPDCEICGGSGMIDSVVTKADARTILEELKLRGIGNGIVQKLVGCFKSIGKFLRILFKKSSYIVNGNNTLIYLDSPATTSAVTYNLKFARAGSLGSISINNNSNAFGTVTLQEVLV